MMILVTLVMGVMFLSPVVLIIAIIARDTKAWDKSHRTHQKNFNGITEKRLTGTVDIYCPKCGSPCCQYVFQDKQVIADMYRTKTRVHLLNPFKPLVEEKTHVIPGKTVQVKKYQCLNCGWIFK